MVLFILPYNFFKENTVVFNTMQNIVVLMEPFVESTIIDAFTTSQKLGNMYLNQFCIDEDAAFELSGVYYFKKFDKITDKIAKFFLGKVATGKDNQFVQYQFIF